MTDLSLLGSILFVIAALLAVAGPLSVGFAAAVVLSMSPFLRLPLQFGAGELGVRPEDGVIAILTVRCLLFHRLPTLSRDVRRFVNAYLVLLVFVALFTMFALATHPANEISWYPDAKALGVTAMGYVALCAISNATDFRRFTFGLQTGAIILGVSALIAAQLADSVAVTETSAYDAQMVATKSVVSSFALGWNSNVVGMTCGGLLLASLPFATRLKPLWSLPVRLSVAGIAAAGLLRSYSRTSIIAVGIVLGASLVRQGKAGRRRAWGYGLGILLLIGLGGALQIRPEAFRIGLSDGVNSGQRLEIWEVALTTVAAQPLGYGIGVGDLAVSNAWGKRLSAHNDVMDFALEIGVPGALCAVFTYFCLWRAMRGDLLPGVPPEAGQIFLFFFICSLSGQVFSFAKQPFFIMGGYLAWINALRPSPAQSTRMGRGTAFDAGESSMLPGEASS
jgi:O-antigen ligase